MGPQSWKSTFTHRSSRISREPTTIHLKPLDEELVGWYLANGPRLEESLVDAIPTQKRAILFYEDVFGQTLNVDRRIAALNSVLSILNVEVSGSDPYLRLLLAPESKHNDSTLLHRIPNIHDLEKRFGAIEQRRSDAIMLGYPKESPVSISNN